MDEQVLNSVQKNECDGCKNEVADLVNDGHNLSIKEELLNGKSWWINIYLCNGCLEKFNAVIGNKLV